MEILKTKHEVENYIHGKFEKNNHLRLDVLSPIDGTKISSLPLSKSREVDAAANAAKQAFQEWSSKTLKERVQVGWKDRRR